MKRKATINDAIDGGAYLDVDGEVITAHQPHLTIDDQDAPVATIVAVWPEPGDSRELFRLPGTATARQIAAELRRRGARRIQPHWQD